MKAAISGLYSSKNQRKLAIIILPLLLIVLGFSLSYYAARYVSAGGSVKCEEYCASITEHGIEPGTLTIPVGSTVQFNTDDRRLHNLGLGRGHEASNVHHDGEDHEHLGKYMSGDFEEGEAWKVTFREKGVFYFHDHYNPSLTVLVVVYEPGSKAAIR